MTLKKLPGPGNDCQLLVPGPEKKNILVLLRTLYEAHDEDEDFYSQRS